MHQALAVIFYDGVSSKPHHAEILPIDQQGIQIRYQFENRTEIRRYHYDQMILIGALGKTDPVVEINDDARIEFLQKELPEWFAIRHKGLNHKVWKLERTPSLIVLSVIVVFSLAFAALKWGVPAASHFVAFKLPENTLNALGNQAKDYVFDMTTQSHLPIQQQEQIRRNYQNTVAEGRPATIIFRQGDTLGANALALPNNTIIVTDELIELAHSDQEILAVLAHEQGHLVQRHSLQQALSSLGFSVIYIAITGDSSDLLHSLPLSLLGAGYSREFEREADLYALELMHKRHLSISHFANFLQRLSDESGEEKTKGTGGDFLSSHPATEKRIQMVRDFEASHLNKP
nr:M48 family metallopeptidase [Acinetobacter sp. Marseille-Q1620]